MASLVTYVDVILPLALPRAYTYAVSVDLVDFIKVGQRVIVQFGKNKFYTAIIKTIHHNKPAVEAKLIEGLADEEPIITTRQLQFFNWISTYYMCTEGEVLNAALPSGLKLSSETKVRYNEHYDGEFDMLNDDEFVIVQALRAQSEITLPQVQDLLKKRNVYPMLKTLYNLGIAISAEEIIEKFRPRTETYVKLNPKYADEVELEKLYADLSRAPKQVELLLAFTQLLLKEKFIKKSILLERSKSDASVLKRLVDREVFKEFKVEVSRLGNFQTDEVEIPELSDAQKDVVTQLHQNFETKNVVLLKGVTGSGKTVVYIEYMKELVESGKQVLYLLPEIALTAQIINRLRKVFGEKVGIYHSKFNPNERVEIWNKVLHGEYKIVIGARSALLLPFNNLGLIVVDEEHDQSLKQVDPSPRYNARDSAIILANMFDAKVLLGTATPAVETFYNTEIGKFGLVRMPDRFSGVSLPNIETVNLRECVKKKKMFGSFSERMMEGIKNAIANKEQVILFINRRGFANYQTCKTCGYVYKCRNCDVSLTYHKFQHKLICHYCGYFENVQTKCKSCGAIDLDIVGSGTQKIEDEITELFPEARVARLDYDSTKTKNGHNNIISQFENRQVDILVGTQMVSKGLDFDHVNLVGIINADQIIHHPGYRSHERAYQLMTQVAGRAGRRQKQGTVIIQTSDPSLAVINSVIKNDYKSMYERELQHRRQFLYPPFTRIIQIVLKHKQVQVVEQIALFLANEMRKANTGLVLGPTVPFVGKVNNYYLREVLIKTNQHTKSLPDLKNDLQQTLDKIKSISEFKGVFIHTDVDPL
jgi:primosomal protein N' (replication factor Y)